MFNLEVLNNYVLSSWKSIATLSNLLAPNLNMAFKQLQSHISDSKEISIQNLLYSVFLTDDFSTEQGKDPVLARMIDFLEGGELPEDESDARKIASQASL